MVASFSRPKNAIEMCDRNLLGREIEGLKESLVACWCLIFQWDFWGEHCSIVGEEDICAGKHASSQWLRNIAYRNNS